MLVWGMRLSEGGWGGGTYPGPTKDGMTKDLTLRIEILGLMRNTREEPNQQDGYPEPYRRPLNRLCAAASEGQGLKEPLGGGALIIV